MTTAQMNDPERDGGSAVDSQVDRKVAGLERRIAKLEASLALRTGDAVVVDFSLLRRDLTKAVTDALCNVRMIPVLDIGGHRKIVEVKISDA